VFTLVPSPTVYIVEDDFGPKLGRSWRETDSAKADAPRSSMISTGESTTTLSASSPSTPQKAGRAMCRTSLRRSGVPISIASS
jgi:hypothetical protein